MVLQDLLLAFGGDQAVDQRWRPLTNVDVDDGVEELVAVREAHGMTVMVLAQVVVRVESFQECAS